MVSTPAQRIHSHALIRDTHVCFPLNPNADLNEIERFRDSDVTFGSLLSIGMDMDSCGKVIQVQAHFRNRITTYSQAATTDFSFTLFVLIAVKRISI